MKVAHLISGGDVGGAKTHVLSLLTELGRSIHVDLICFTDGPFANDARDLGIPVTIINSGNIVHDYKMLRDFIATGGFDLIHCHGSRANMMGALLKRALNLPVVTTVHSDYRLDYLGRPLHRLTYGAINAVALRFLDYRIGVSDAMVDLLIRRRFRPDTLFSIYNGLDFSKTECTLSRSEFLDSLGISYDGNTVVFGIAARLSPVKDYPTLIKAFAKVHESRPNIRLVIAGDGEQAGELKKLVSDFSLDRDIIFAGWLTDTDSFYNALDINMLTSLSETFPYALTEGARMRCATISSRVGGVPYLISHGVDGLLFEPGDVAALSSHIETLAGDEALRVKLGNRLYEKASVKFSLEATRSRQLEIYETIIRRKNREKKKRDGVMICGAYGKGNVGDDSILEAVLHEMRELDPDMPIYVLSREPMETAACCRVRAIYTFNIPKFIQAMRKTRLYLNGGGSLIQDVTSTRSLQYYLWNIALARMTGNQVLMYGCGIGPVNRPANRKRAGKMINKYVHAITLREDSSKKELEKLGVRSPKVILAADPTLTLPPADSVNIDSKMISSHIPPDGNYICFSLRPWPGFDKKAEIFARAADYAYENYGLTAVFLPIEPKRDLPAIEKAAGFMTSPHYILEDPENGRLAMGLMSRMKVVVAMRLHALVFAASQGVPLIGVVYDQKVSAFLRYINQDLYLELDQITLDWLKAQIDEAVLRAGDADKIARSVARLREMELENRKTAKALLEKT